MTEINSNQFSAHSEFVVCTGGFRESTFSFTNTLPEFYRNPTIFQRTFLDRTQFLCETCFERIFGNSSNQYFAAEKDENGEVIMTFDSMFQSQWIKFFSSEKQKIFVRKMCQEKKLILSENIFLSSEIFWKKKFFISSKRKTTFYANLLVKKLRNINTVMPQFHFLQNILVILTEKISANHNLVVNRRVQSHLPSNFRFLFSLSFYKSAKCPSVESSERQP